MKNIIYILFAAFVLTSCEDKFLDLDPLDSFTESSYFNEPEHFDNATNGFYIQIVGYRAVGGSEYAELLDFGSDLIGTPQPYARGEVQVPDTDNLWDSKYSFLRDIHIFFDKVDQYEGDKSELSRYVAEAHFFRAWNYFELLRRYGGVPLITQTLDIDSPELYGPRNSRYEVMELILSDLDAAIAGLPQEQSISDADKGKISIQAAQAFKARVLLYEATWEKYVGTSTDFEGSGGPSGDNFDAYINEVIDLSREVIATGPYELWNYNEELDNLTHWFLFNLEDDGSNPAGLTKTTNKEFIIQTIYDYNLRRGNENISHTVYGRLSPSRKFLDMILASDGLPVDKSETFLGYNTYAEEFANRDYRMRAYFGEEIPETGTVPLPGLNTAGSGDSNGIKGRKFRSYNYGTYRNVNEESFNYPQIRLAEVYLNLAEALMERDGQISDEDLNLTINPLRERAGLPPLTNAFVAEHGLDMMEEIKRERTVELFAENTRFHDLKRWGIAEEALGATVVGPVIEGTVYENNPDLYNPETYIYGEIDVETGRGVRSAVVIDPASNRNFQRYHYLYPLPAIELELNDALVQNPGY